MSMDDNDSFETSMVSDTLPMTGPPAVKESSTMPSWTCSREGILGVTESTTSCKTLTFPSVMLVVTFGPCTSVTFAIACEHKHC